MKLFVTGGTGFVGSHFLRLAMEAGHEVVAQRRPGSKSRLKLSREPQWVDRLMDEDFSAELAGCDAVVHLAAHTPNPPYAPLDEWASAKQSHAHQVNIPAERGLSRCR
jgi:nucleoside-diphosphate-sugar epimerase